MSEMPEVERFRNMNSDTRTPKVQIREATSTCKLRSHMHLQKWEANLESEKGCGPHTGGGKRVLGPDTPFS